jgi:hypothetical protein
MPRPGGNSCRGSCQARWPYTTIRGVRIQTPHLLLVPSSASRGSPLPEAVVTGGRGLADATLPRSDTSVYEDPTSLQRVASSLPSAELHAPLGRTRWARTGRAPHWRSCHVAGEACGPAQRLSAPAFINHQPQNTRGVQYHTLRRLRPGSHPRRCSRRDTGWLSVRVRLVLQLLSLQWLQSHRPVLLVLLARLVLSGSRRSPWCQVSRW